MNPEDILVKLKTDASSKTSETLDAIYTICMEQKERGINDFSVATIARLGFGRGVPKAQSLRNKTGEKYRALLKAFEDKHLDKKPKVAKKELDWIEEIPNPKHRLLAKIMASELAEANHKVREMIPPGTRIEVYDHKAPLPDEDAKLIEIERRAIEYLLSQQFLEKWNFKKTEYGELIDENGNVVFKAATTDALEKALRYL